MREQGLEVAINAVGGVGALARALGISQPSVSNWQRIPPERVIAVEQITGVGRHLLRPDLYPLTHPGNAPAAQADNGAGVIDEIDLSRAAEYGLLAHLLFRAPTDAVLQQVAALKGDATPLGMAHLKLAQAASEIDLGTANREFFDLFIGIGRGELLPYASYYLTGFLHERPLALVREDMGKLGIARAERAGEPEDHIAILMDIMANLIRGAFAGEGVDAAAFYARHIEPWGERLFADLEVAKASKFYRAIGRVGSLFLSIETEAGRLPS
jgi:TorA maturation chaperone TorD